MEDRPMTGEEVLQQLLQALNGNGMQQAANSIYELCAYVDSMTHKVDDMTEEITRLREDIQKMQDDTLGNRIKQSLKESEARLEQRCGEIKEQLFEIKTGIKNKASEIMDDFKMRGKEALNRVSEFVGLKEKLTGLRNKVKDGIIDTDHTISKIDAFGKGMREVGQMVANIFRTFADKEEVDYSQKEKRFSKTELLKKPWKWQKKVYESMVLRLDAAIDKVEDIKMDVELYHKDKQRSEMIDKVQDDMEIVPLISAVAEPERQYGAEVFEEYENTNNLNISVVRENKTVEIEKSAIMR